MVSRIITGIIWLETLWVTFEANSGESRGKQRKQSESRGKQRVRYGNPTYGNFYRPPKFPREALNN